MYSKTAIRELSARYRLILRKCFLLNLGLVFISTSALATSNNVQNGNVIIDADTTMTQSTLDVEKLTITEGNSLDFTSDYKGVHYAINSTLHNIDQLEIEKNASASFKTTYVEFETLNLTDATSKENASQLSLKNSSFDGGNITIGQNNTLNMTDSELYGSNLTLKKGSKLNYTCLNCEDDEEDKINSVADFAIEFDNISANNATIVLGDTERATEQSLPDQASLEFKEQLNIQNNSSITLNENTQLFYSGFEGKGNISITDSSLTLNDNSRFLIGEEDDEASSENPYNAPTAISNSSITLNNNSSIEVYDENTASFSLNNKSSLTLNNQASLSLTNLLLQGGSTLGLNTENTTAEISTIYLKDATINSSGTLNVDTLTIAHSNAKVNGEISDVDIQINADVDFDKTFTLTESPYSDAYDFNNNITVSKGKKLSILTPDSYKYENGYVEGEDDEDEFNRRIFMKDLTVNGGLEISSTNLYADETTFGENASLTANMASIESASMTIASGSYNLTNDSSLDARGIQTINGGTFTLDDSEMGGDEGVYISDGTFTLRNDSEIATNGFENAPDVSISGGDFTFNSSHILSRTEDERKGSITISGGDISFNKGLIGAYNYSDNEYETQEGGNISISGGTITFNGGSDIHSEKYWDESKGILSNTILAENISLSGDAVMNISKGATLQTLSKLYMEDDYMDFEEAPSSLTISENATLNLEGNLRAQLDIEGGKVVVKKTSSIISGLSYDSTENTINLENNGVLTIDEGATLTLGHVEKNWGSSKNTIVNDTLNVNDGTVNLLGTLNADLTGSEITISGPTGKINSSLNIAHSNAKVNGEISDIDIQINADVDFDKTFTLTESPYSDGYDFNNNITVNKGKKLSILTPDSYKYENGYVKGEDDEDEFNRRIFMKDLTVNGGLEVSSTNLYANETTFGENASLTANMASIESASMTIAGGSYNLTNDSSLDAFGTQTINGGTFTLDNSEMDGDEGVYISDGTFTLSNNSEIATNGFENAPDVNISGGKFTFNSSQILSRTEDERKGSITISGGDLSFNKGLIGAYNYSDNEYETQEGGNISISGGTITFNGGSDIHSEKYWDESKGILSNAILAENISLSGDAVMNISKGATLQTLSKLYMEDDYMDFEEAPSSLTISENATLNLEGNLRAQLNIQGGEVSVKKTSSIISGLSYVSMENIINLENNGVLTIDKGATLTLGHVEKNWGSSKNTIVNDTLNVNGGTLNLLGTLNADLTGSEITISGSTGKINGSLKGFESLTLHNRGGKLSAVAKEFTDIDNITLSGDPDSKGQATTTYTLDKNIFTVTENPRYWAEWKYIDDDDPYEMDCGFNKPSGDDDDYDYGELISFTPYSNQVAGNLTIQTANLTSSNDLAVGNLFVQDNATATIKGRFVTGWPNPLDDYNPTRGNISVLNNSSLTIGSSPSNWEEYLAIRNLTIDKNSKFVADNVYDIGVSNLSLSNGSSLEVKNNTRMSTANLEADDSSFSIDKAWFEGYESNINNSTLKATNQADVAFDILTATDSTLIVDKKATISSNDLTINDGDILVETGSRLGALNKENIMIDEGYIFGYSLDEYFETPKSDITISDATITLNGTASLQNGIALTKITESGPDEIIGVLDKETFENPDLLIDKYIKQARKSGDFDYISEREYRQDVRDLIQSQSAIKGNITLTDTTVQMNGTSSITNSLFNEEDDSGYVNFVGGDVIANGKNTISATEAVTFDGTNIEVLAGKTLTITSENDIGTTINDIRLKLAGTLNAQLKGSVSTLVLSKQGKYTGKWRDLDFSGLTNFGISGITSLKDLGAAYDAYNRYGNGNLERFEVTDKSKLTWDMDTNRMLDFNSLSVNTGSTLDVKRNLIMNGSLLMDNAKLNLAKDTYIQADTINLINTNVNITGSTYYDRNGIYSTKLTSNNLVIDNEGTTNKTNLKNVTLLSSNGSIDYSAYITGSATLTNVSVKGDLWLDNEFTYDKKGNIVYKTPATLTNVTASAQSGEPTTQGKLHVRNQKVVLKSGNNFTDGINLYENAIVDVTDNTDTAGATSIVDGGTLNVYAGKTFATSALENNGIVNVKGILYTDSSINGNGFLNIQNAKSKVYGDVEDNTIGFEKVKTNLSSIFYGNLENVGFGLTSSTLTIDKDISLGDINMEKSTLNLADDLTTTRDLNANASTLNLGTSKLKVDNIRLTGASNINLSVEGKENYGQLIATDEMFLGLGDKADKISLNVTIGKTVSKTELDGAQFNFLDYHEVYGNLSSVKINNNRYKFTETAIGQFEVEETTTGKGVIARYSGESKNAMSAASALVDNSAAFSIKRQQQLSENLNTLSQQVGAEQDYLDSLEATNPDTNGMVQGNESSNINMGMDAASTRLSNGSDASTIGRSAGDEASQQGSMWTKVLYNKSKMDSSNQYRGFKGYASGLAIGLDKYVAEDVKMGIAYAYTDADIKNSINKTTADSHFALLYGEYKPNNWFINSIASYGWSNYNQKATSAIGATTADFDVHSTAVKITSGYDVLMNNTTITPALGILYTNIKREAYSDSDEKRISANSSDVITLSAMTKLKSEYKSGSNLSFIPEVRFGITYDVMNDGQSSIVNLSNGTSYTIEERALNRFGTEFGFGIRVKYDNRYEFSAGYELRAREDYRDQTALIEAKYHF